MRENIQNIQKLLQKPVVMIGLMGAGKTKIGGLLAAALNIPFVDADHEIELAAGCTVAEIFARHGESAFRDLERKVIARLLSEEIRVIATGGGAVMNDETAALVWAKSTSIWLRADLDILVERTGRTPKRPLLQNGNPRDILAALMEKRHPVYARADIAVDTDDNEAEHTLQKLLNAFEDHLNP